jgi:hypothetical protein
LGHSFGHTCNMLSNILSGFASPLYQHHATINMLPIHNVSDSTRSPCLVFGPITLYQFRDSNPRLGSSFWKAQPCIHLPPDWPNLLSCRHRDHNSHLSLRPSSTLLSLQPPQSHRARTCSYPSHDAPLNENQRPCIFAVGQHSRELPRKRALHSHPQALSPRHS